MLWIELTADRIFMRRKELAVSTRRVEDAISIFVYSPPDERGSNVGRREILTVSLGIRHGITPLAIATFFRAIRHRREVGSIASTSTMGVCQGGGILRRLLTMA